MEKSAVKLHGTVKDPQLSLQTPHWAAVRSRQTSPFYSSPHFKPAMLLSMTACGWDTVYQMEHCLSFVSLQNTEMAQYCLCGEQPFLEHWTEAAAW